MIIEKQLEQQIIEAIRPDDPRVWCSGAWSASQPGDVKGDEPADAGATLVVTVSQARTATYCEGGDLEVDIPVELSCAVSRDADPTGKLLLDLYEQVSAKVWGWVRWQTSVVETELTVTGDDGVLFSPGGVARDAGTPPLYGNAVRAWVWTISFTVKGILH